MEADCESALQAWGRSADWDAAAATEAEQLLHCLLKSLQPTRNEWKARNDVVRRVQRVVAGMPDFTPDHLRRSRQLPRDDECLAQVHVFGSFCSSLWHRGSDLDLTIMGSWRNRSGQLLDMHAMQQRDTADMLHRIRRALLAHGVASEDPAHEPAQVINARVPLITFTDSATGIEVDITVSNHGGAFKSRFMAQLSQFDTRLPSLYRLVKLWAEANNLNDPKCGTFNSWSLTQMVIFHLQQCRPAVLPPLWQLFHDEPPDSEARPLEVPPCSSNGSSGSGSAGARAGRRAGATPPRNGSNPRQAGSVPRASAPYELLDVCEQQARRCKPLYAAASGEQHRHLLVLLSGFMVRFREALSRWLDAGEHRGAKMSTWHGCWYAGGARWAQEYLVGFEDPFDTADNTARTLGTVQRNDGGHLALLDALDAAVAAVTCLSSSADVSSMLRLLFRQEVAAIRAGDDPVRVLQAQREGRRQQQRALQARVLQQPEREQQQQGQGQGQRWEWQQQQQQQLMDRALQGLVL